MVKAFVILIWIFILLESLSCKKESDRTYCWQGFDPSGYDIPGLLLCGKTESEVQAAYPQYWFHKQDEQTFCWQVQTQQGDTFYMRRIPASMVDKMRSRGGYVYTKKDCNSFCVWKWHEKHQSKITGLFNPTRAVWEVYHADSCSKLFVGKQVTVRETADSIIYRVFMEESNP